VGKPYLLYVENPFEAEEKLASLGFKTVLFGRRVKLFSKGNLNPKIFENLGLKVKRIEPSSVTMEDVFVFKVRNEV